MKNQNCPETIEKQPNSRYCFVCGVDNPAGLQARFYNQPDGTVLTKFVGRQEHQGFPGRFHGGIIAALMDEAMGRVLNLNDLNAWGVTRSLDIQYRLPVPLAVELTAICWKSKSRGRLYWAEGHILLPDGRVAVYASGSFAQIQLRDMETFDPESEKWQVFPDEKKSSG